MRYIFLAIAALGGLFWWMLNSDPKNVDTVLAHKPIDDMSGMLRDVQRFGAKIDYDISSDGNGSLRIDVKERTLVNLFDIWGNEEDLSFRKLVYQARVRTQDANGPVFLVMQAGVTGAPEGQMPVVGREGAITGTNDWTTLEIGAGNPGGSKHLTTTLQLEVGGAGTVWVDDVKLISRQTI